MFRCRTVRQVWGWLLSCPLFMLSFWLPAIIFWPLHKFRMTISQYDCMKLCRWSFILSIHLAFPWCSLRTANLTLRFQACKNLWPDVQLSFPHAHIILLDDLSWPSKMQFNIWQARLSEFSGHMYTYFLINKIKINWLKIYLEVLH